jgi:hypothetical protein
VVPAGEPGHVLDLGERDGGDDRSHAEDLGERAARCRHRGGQLLLGLGHLGVNAAQVLQEVASSQRAAAAAPAGWTASRMRAA